MDPARRLTRRRLLATGAAGAAGVALSEPALLALGRPRRRLPLAAGGSFHAGVASGDPTHRAATLWTRLGDVERDASVRLEVARDPGFARVIARELVPARAARDHTVKVRVGRLDPDERYWYRFETRDGSSPVGRVQTAPAPDSRRPLRLAFFSCQQYTSGWYGAYRHLLAQDPDFVICLGDYVYEKRFYQPTPGREDGTGANGDGEVRTLAEYRDKHRLYRSDSDLQALHRRVPILAMWDDHEVLDNYVGDDRDSPRYGGRRMSAGQRAFLEYLPTLEFWERRRTYRRFSFGRLAEVFLLDERSYRDDQPCDDTTFQPCGEVDRRRDFLGPAQMEWLRDRLRDSRAAWKLIGNQLLIMPLDVAPGVPLTVDTWQGYTAERDELLAHIDRANVRDVAFLTGDIHVFLAGHVLREGRSGPPVAVEFVGGASTTPGATQTLYDQGEIRTGRGLPLPPREPTPLAGDRFPLVNPHLAYAETSSNGYALVDVRPEQLDVTYFASRDVRTRAGSRDVRTLQRFTVPRGVPRVERA